MEGVVVLWEHMEMPETSAKDFVERESLGRLEQGPLNDGEVFAIYSSDRSVMLIVSLPGAKPAVVAMAKRSQAATMLGAWSNQSQRWDARKKSFASLSEAEQYLYDKRVELLAAAVGKDEMVKTLNL